MKIVVFAEHNGQTFDPSNQAVIRAAKQLGGTIDILILGHSCEALVQEAQTWKDIHRLRVLDADGYYPLLAERIAPILAREALHYDYLLAPANTFGKNYLPRAAAMLNVAVISDVIDILSNDTFVRPIYAGNALATVQSLDTLKLLTIRTAAFLEKEDSTKEKNSHHYPIDMIAPIDYLPETSTFIRQELTVSHRPDLYTARKIVSGGRGLKSADNFKLLEALADQLGAAVGASRAAVDAGFAPNDYQVGQTGKIVSPELYIAIGISGAIQHVAGMKDSRVIVAINNDPDAPIFEIADYGLVGDLFEILPQLQAELNKN